MTEDTGAAAAVATAGTTTARSKLVFETIGVLAGVFLITIAFSVLQPAIVALRIVPIIILFELSEYAVLVGFVYAVNRLNRRTLTEGFGFGLRPVGRQVVVGALVFLLTISFIVVPMLLGARPSDMLGFKPRSPLVLVYYAIRAFVFVGFGEELIWRGYFFNRTREITGSTVWAIVLPSLLFGLWHFPVGRNVLQVFATAGIGAVYGLVRAKVRDASTMATGFAHGLHDAAIVVMSYFLI